MAGKRCLISLRRHVPAERRSAYREAWQVLELAVTAGGAHAWRFISAEDSAMQLEFLEFRSSSNPTESPEVRRMLETLEREAGPATVEQWLEDR